MLNLKNVFTILTVSNSCLCVFLCVCVCVCVRENSIARGERWECVCELRRETTTHYLYLPSSYTLVTCCISGVWEERARRRRRRGRAKRRTMHSFFLTSFSSPTHLLHKRCEWGSLPTTKWQRGEAYQEFAITDTTAPWITTTSNHNQEVSDTSRSLCVVPRRSRVACVCVCGWKTTHVRSHSQESPNTLPLSCVRRWRGWRGEKRGQTLSQDKLQRWNFFSINDGYLLHTAHGESLCSIGLRHSAPNSLWVSR